MLYRTWGKVGEERRKGEEEGRRGRRGNERWRGGKGRREKRRRRRGGVRMKGKGERERVRIEEGKGDNAHTSLLHTSVMHLGEMHKVTHPTTKTRLFLLLFFNGASSDRIIWWHLVGYHNA